MTSNPHELAQGERTLSTAAGMVRSAKGDFDKLAASLESEILAQRGKWQGAGGTAFFTLHQAWTEKQRTIVGALNQFEASLTSTERDNVNTDDTQSSSYHRTAGRLDGV